VLVARAEAAAPVALDEVESVFFYIIDLGETFSAVFRELGTLHVGARSGSTELLSRAF
jgi:hypothetical protein